MKENGFYADLPHGRLDISGDQEHGFRPFQLLVAAISVCTGGVLRKVMGKMRMDISDIQIETKEDRNPDMANRIEKIHLHLTITGQNLTEEKINKALVVARKNCPMVQSVIGSIEVEETFEFRNE